MNERDIGRTRPTVRDGGVLTNHIQRETDEPMMRRKRKEESIHQHNMLEIVDDALPVQEVHDGSQKVPIQRLCEPQLLVSRWYACDSNHLFEGDDLHSRDHRNQVKMPGGHRAEKDPNHRQRPNGPGDESLLLLLVL